MKQRRQFKNPVWVLLFMILLWGCEMDYLNEMPESLQQLPPALEEAKAWYNAQKQGQEVLLFPKTRAEEGILFYTEPSWTYYYETENSRYKALDVALTDRIGLDFVSQENLHLYHKTGNYSYRRSYTRLVILTDKTNARKTGFLMTIIPSADYTREHPGQIDKTTYLRRDQKLDGIILFHNLNGSFSNGWQYTKGKVTGSIHEILFNSGLSMSFPDSIQTVTCELLSCSYSVLNPETKGGETPIYGGELPEANANGQQPEENKGGITIAITPPGAGNTGNYENNNSGSGGGGGGNGFSGVPPDSLKYPSLHQVCDWKKSKLTDSQKSKLNENIKSFIKLYPKTKKLLDYRKSQNNYMGFEINPTESRGQSARYSQGKNILYVFSADILSSQGILEEIFHSTQFHCFYKSGPVPGVRNIEFEAKLCYDLFCKEESFHNSPCGWVVSYVDAVEFDKFVTKLIETQNFDARLLEMYKELGMSWNDPHYPKGTFDPSFTPKLIEYLYKK